MCAEEAAALDKRRSREDEDIQALDTATIPPGESWYLIDSNWLYAWNAFKNGSGSTPAPSPFPLIQGANATVLRDNLARGTHYRGVNEH